MTRRDDLVRLRDAIVFAGDLDRSLPWSKAVGAEYGIAARNAYRGDMNEALVFFEAALPGWVVQEIGNNSRSMGWNALIVNEAGNYHSSHYCNPGFLATPARALLLATLDALIAQEDAAPDMENPISEMRPETGADQCEFLDWPSCPLVDCNCIEAREKRRADAAQDRGTEG